jgi:intein/homing endonuclease
MTNKKRKKKINKNLKFLRKSLKDQKWGLDKDGNEVITEGYRGVVLEGSSRCFNGDQKVVTNNGYEQISKLKEGDLVKSYNEDKNINQYKRVIKTHKYKNNKKCLRVTLKNGDTIECTEDHKFYYLGKWVSISDIRKYFNDRKRNMENNT